LVKRLSVRGTQRRDKKNHVIVRVQKFNPGQIKYVRTLVFFSFFFLSPLGGAPHRTKTQVLVLASGLGGPVVRFAFCCGVYRLCLTCVCFLFGGFPFFLFQGLVVSYTRKSTQGQLDVRRLLQRAAACKLTRHKVGYK
jgi:hypothetical protein